MKVHTLISLFFALQNGNAGPIYTGTEGGNITVGCLFVLPGARRMFCKGQCNTGTILVDSTSDRAQSGRYSIEYKMSLLSPVVMNVSIIQLIKSDSGLYSCKLDRQLWIKGYEEFEILVTKASPTSQPNAIPRPSTASLRSSLSPATATQSFESSSGTFTPSSFSTGSTVQAETGSPAGSGPLLYASLSSVIAAIILLVAVVIFCSKRSTKSKEHPVETEFANVTEVDRGYEEIKSPAVQVSTVYTRIHQYTKPNSVETSDEYSLATAPAARPHSQTEEGSYNSVYTEVDFTNGAAAPPPQLHLNDVVYSVARVETRPANQATLPL